MRRILSILAVSSFLLLAGCATQTRSDTLTTTLNAYASTLRWGDFQSAAQFLDPQIRAAHPLSKLDLARYQQVKVSEYDEGAGPVPAGAGSVQQTVHINLINVHTQSERIIVDHQTWHYDEKAKHWWLTSGLPDITQD
jgi:outer membrane murein-binding lipoprotein Lpp